MRTPAAILGLVWLLPCQVCAQDTNQFYAGRRIVIVVGSAAGSGYDAYARLLERHLARHIPGTPAITVQNMPGGGGLTAANYLYNAAAKDGTVIGEFQRGLLISPWVMPEGVRYDVSKIKWIGSTTAETGVLAVWHTAPQMTVQDLFKDPLIIGGSGPQTDSETTPRAYAKLLGLKFRIVSGYPSTGPILLAMERGELQGIGNSSWSNWTTSYAHYLKDRKVRLLLQSGLERNPEIEGVPMALDLAKTPDQRNALELLLAPNKIGRPFAAPPGIPEDRIDALRNAFDLTMKDPAFLAEAADRKLDISPVDGLSIERMLARFAALPDTVTASARDAIKPE